MLGLKLKNISKRGPREQVAQDKIFKLVTLKFRGQ